MAEQRKQDLLCTHRKKNSTFVAPTGEIKQRKVVFLVTGELAEGSKYKWGSKIGEPWEVAPTSQNLFDQLRQCTGSWAKRHNNQNEFFWDETRVRHNHSHPLTRLRGFLHSIVSKFHEDLRKINLMVWGRLSSLISSESERKFQSNLKLNFLSQVYE